MWDEDNENAYEEYVSYMEAMYEYQREEAMLMAHQAMTRAFPTSNKIIITKEKAIIIGGE